MLVYGLWMAINPKYLKDERMLVRFAAILGLAVGILAILFKVIFQKDPSYISQQAVWSYVSEQAGDAGLDPGFVYAIIWAESGLNAHARSSVARGLMQLTRSAWKEVSDESYRKAWDWQTNIEVGIDYLVFCRDFLHQKDQFSYPLLAACYRYGPYAVAKQQFKIERLKQPKNKIYKSIFGGTIRPVEPPVTGLGSLSP